MAFVQSKVGASGNGTSLAAVFTSSVVAGNLIIVAIPTFQGTTGVDDTLGNTYTQIELAAGGSVLEVWYAISIASGACTVTAHWSPAANGGIVVHEYALFDTLDVHDKANTNPGVTSTDGDKSPNVVPTTSGQLIFGALFDGGGASGTYATGTGFTNRVTTTIISGLYQLVTEDLTQGAAASIAATWTGNSTSRYTAVIATFKAPAGLTAQQGRFMGVLL